MPTVPKIDFRINSFNRCLNCGDTHPLCLTDGCKNPTHCPPDERGEPFRYCNTCDTAMVPDADSREPAGEAGASC